jgi:hypothetical protein
MMVLVMVIGVWLGWHLRTVRIQQDAVAAIKRAGGSVTYDWEWGNYNPDIIDSNGKPRAPKWLADRVGVDHVASVVLVDLVPRSTKDPNKADDATLAHVGRLGRLESLWLNGTAITDAGLAHIQGLTGLRDLTIGDTRVSDAGLAHLKGMTRLGTLYIIGNRVTDDGVLELERALPGLQVIREENIVSVANVTRAMADLDFARSQPIRVACALLDNRAQVMAYRGNTTEFIATVNALCDLEAHDKVSLLKLAQSLAQCVGLVGPSVSPRLSAAEREALRLRCTDRGIAALSLAIELGYDNVARLNGDFPDGGRLWNFRSHPAFPKLVARMKTKRPGR